jgi:hypothetical protein
VEDLAFLNKIYKIIKSYRKEDAYVSIFKDISGYYYHENYHSDILAYYLKFNTVKKEFITWLNKLIEERKRNDKTERIKYEEYYDGLVERERDKIDILIHSSNNKKAIIIENKSNNASDQFKQVYRYYKTLTAKDIEVEAIFYLNKNSYKSPDLSDLLENEKEEVNNLLVIGKLVEDTGFTENVIKNVIANTNDIRLNALSQEIKELFYYTVYGSINMENLSSFVVELSQDNNLEKLKKAIKAYNDIPVFLTEKYMSYIKRREPDYNVWLYKPYYIAVDVLKGKIKYTVDIIFYLDKVDFEMFIKNGEQKYLEDLKEKSGNDFPFTGKRGNRYVVTVNESINTAIVEKMIENILKILRNI